MEVAVLGSEAAVHNYTHSQSVQVCVIVANWLNRFFKYLCVAKGWDYRKLDTGDGIRGVYADGGTCPRCDVSFDMTSAERPAPVPAPLQIPGRLQTLFRLNGSDTHRH
ncbi:hypothetical protein BaRGS_00009474 [Batillaria attramentaria]|uniref:Uncharacterized protein n=1 Tax=Batillaria attramentaria TaxID=370345 RepID=A0ABD0LI81_9CAEN